MTRKRIRLILRDSHGSISEIAESLGITQPAVSLYLTGKTNSERIAKACEAKAQELKRRKS